MIRMKFHRRFIHVFMEFVDIISRDQLDLIIEEQKLSHSGLVDASNSIELGKIAGVHMLIVGEVTQILIPKTKKTTNKIRENKSIIVRTESYQDSDGNTRKRQGNDVRILSISYNETR